MQLIHRRLLQFLTVLEVGNIHGAAKKLHIAQPALSRAMKELESDVGLMLLIREPRGVQPTHAGLVLAEHTERSLEIMKQGLVLARNVNELERGSLNIGYGIFASMGNMPDIVVSFREKYPNIDVNLRLLATNEQIIALNKGSIDIGFAFSIACKPPLFFQKISSEQPVILVNRKHRWAKRKNINIIELANEPMVMGNLKRWGYYREIVNAICLQAGFSPNVFVEADELPDMIAHLRMSDCVAIMGQSMVSQLPEKLTAIKLKNNTLPFNLSIVYTPSNINPALKIFTEHIEKMV